MPPRALFVVTLAAYAALTVAVMTGSPLDRLDRLVRASHLVGGGSGWRLAVHEYVLLGQRGPSTAVASVWILWLCHRRRSVEPAVRFVVALVLLNLSVGVVKVATGRWGPRVTAHAHDVLAGGDIYPSGHTSNAVVLFGVLAMLAGSHRRAAALAAVWISLSVGLSTLYLDTHWVTDVLGGWLAGALVLLAVPRATRFSTPRVERVVATLRQRVTRSRRALGRAPSPGAAPRSDPEPHTRSHVGPRGTSVSGYVPAASCPRRRAGRGRRRSAPSVDVAAPGTQPR